jgi:hypothetical protein
VQQLHTTSESSQSDLKLCKYKNDPSQKIGSRPPWVKPLLWSVEINRIWQGTRCEQAAWHSFIHSHEQDKPNQSIHVPNERSINNVISPSSLGMEPVSWLYPIRTEWQGTICEQAWLWTMQDKTHQSIHVPNDRSFNNVSSPSTVGMEPFVEIYYTLRDNVCTR